jgi:hypothetical protein
MPQRTASSPEFRSLSSGSASPSDPINPIFSDYVDRDPHLFSRFYTTLGRVVDTWPETNTCLVSAGFQGYIRCVYKVSNFSTVIGVSEVYSPQIGDHVIVAKAPDVTYGIIVCGVLLPSEAIPGTKITPAIYEQYRGTFFAMGKAKTFDNDDLEFTGDKTMIADDIIPGEISSISESHVGRVQGKLYYRTQAGNLVSITLNLMDDLMDIVAHNLQVNNSGFKFRSFCDFGRNNQELIFGPDLKAFVGDQYKGHTNRITSGWLSSGVASLTTKDYKKGTVFSDEWTDELGIVSQRSVSSCWMQKLNGIYLPGRKRIEDDHQIKGDKEIYDSEPRKGFKIFKEGKHPASFGCAARDYAAWQSSGEYRFKRYEKYEKDWKDPEPKGGEAPSMGGGQYCDFGEFINIEQKVEGISDHQYARKGEAFCGVLPDGSVLMRDAWGSSVELRGGKLVLTSVKDIEIISGKNVILLAGHDLVLKSKKSAEFHTTEGNIRVRSGKNTYIDSNEGSVQITALNTKGPDVIEKKGDKYSPSGIILKTNGNVLSRAPVINCVADSVFAVMGPDREPKEGEEKEKPPFVLIRSHSSLHWADQAHFLYTEAGTPPKRKGMVMVNQGTVQCGQFGVFEETAYTKGYLFSEKTVAVLDHVLSNGIHASYKFPGPVAGLKEPIKIPPEEYKRYADFGEICEKVPIQKVIEDCRLPWDKEDYDDIAWRYRTQEEYNTKEHKWFESFWQRQYKAETVKWKKDDDKPNKDVDMTGEMAWPGRDYLNGTEDKCWITYEEVNVEKDGTPKLYKDQKQEGGKFKELKFNDMKFHP